MYPIIDPETNEEVIEAINTLAEKVKLEIKQGKPGHYLPGDENKMSKADVLKKTGITKKTLNAILYGYDESSKKGLKSLPNTETLWMLCNTFDCEIEYLLGFQDDKKKVVGSVTNITGLREEVVQHLIHALDGQKEYLEESNVADPEQYLRANPFLEYLILHEKDKRLFQRIDNEEVVRDLIKHPEANKESLRLAEEALEKTRAILALDDPVVGMVYGYSGNQIENQEGIFYSYLRASVGLDGEALEQWIDKEFHCSKEALYRWLLVWRTRMERLRVIEDCFSDLVKDYLKEVENDAEK